MSDHPKFFPDRTIWELHKNDGVSRVMLSFQTSHYDLMEDQLQYLNPTELYNLKKKIDLTLNSVTSPYGL